MTGEFVVKMTAPGILEFSMEGEPGLSVKVTAELSPEEAGPFADALTEATEVYRRTRAARSPIQ